MWKRREERSQRCLCAWEREQYQEKLQNQWDRNRITLSGTEVPATFEGKNLDLLANSGPFWTDFGTQLTHWKIYQSFNKSRASFIFLTRILIPTSTLLKPGLNWPKSRPFPGHSGILVWIWTKSGILDLFGLVAKLSSVHAGPPMGLQNLFHIFEEREGFPRRGARSTCHGF